MYTDAQRKTKLLAMNNDALIYRLYTISDLRDWLFHSITNGISDYMISYARAWSLINNPEAKSDDIVLSVVFDNEQPIGYTAVFPEHVSAWGERYYWGTTQWLEPEYRGKGIAGTMMKNIKDAINHRYIGLDSSISSVKLDQKQGYQIVCYPRHFYIWKKQDGNILTKCKEILIQRTNNRVLKQLKTIEFTNRVVPIISTSTYRFIAQHSTSDLFLRSQEMFNWILNYPFMSAIDYDDHTEKEKCAFGANVNTMELRAIEVYVKEKLAGVYIYSIIDDVFKLLYVYYDETYKANVFASLISKVLHKKAKQFYTFQKDLYEYMQSKGIKNINSKYTIDQIALTLPPGVRIDQSLSIQGGDGDMFC